MAKPKAYSYLRFSTPEQQQGDSKRRQLDLARHYADAHGLDLDDTLTFHDLGVSAFRGKNRDAALGAFIKAAEEGRVRKGSYLLVESLDRLSRAAPYQALGQFEEILSHGITVVTVQDQKEWTHKDIKGGDVVPLLSSLLVMARAHEESATKGKRMKAAWRGKREKAATHGHKLTSQCPAWLSLDKKAEEFRVNEERATVIRRIFDMTLEGSGKRKIAERLNIENVATFGRSAGWQSSYIQKILDNEAVIGISQPMRREYGEDGRRVRIADGEPLLGYYPVIVDKAVFHRAREMRTTRRISGGQTGKRFSNVFSGLARCGACGASMHYLNKGRGWTYLHCSNAKRKVGNCTAHPWPYKDTEGPLLWTGINRIDFREVYPSMVEGAQKALKALEDTRVITEADLERTKDRIEALLDGIQDRQDNPHVRDRLDKLTVQEEEQTRQLEEIEANIRQEQDRLDNAGVDLDAVQDALGEWFAEQDTADDARAYQLRARLNQLLKRVVAEIQFHPGDGPNHSRRKAEVQLKGTVLAFTTDIQDFEESDGYILMML